MTDTPVSPRVHTLVVCDDIELVADEPDVFNLLGVRTGFPANGFPYTHPQLCVYVQATGYPGTAALRIAVVHGDSDEEEFVYPDQEIPFDGPLRVLPLYWYLEDCTFPEAGIYYVQVYCGDRILFERQFHLTLATDSTNGRA
jgi:hypothetical protein